MKFLAATWFILLAGMSYALPFQTPVSGDYQCFAGAESPFDVNAQDTGAILTINADSSYTLSANDSSENGSVQASEDSSADLEQLFQNGSTLLLQPSSGSTTYEGFFVTDKLGGRYVFVYTTNTTLRCESPDADIAKAVEAVAKEELAAQQPQTDTSQTNAGQPTMPSQTPASDYTPAATYDEALAVVWSTGKIAVLHKEWCDARSPDLQTSNAQALETWQAGQFFYELDGKFRTAMGTSMLTLEEDIASKREGFFAGLDSSVSDPKSECQNLLNVLNETYNLREQFPNEYALIESGGGESLSAEVINLSGIGDATAGGMLEAGDYQCLTAADNSAYTEELGFPDWTREFTLSFYPNMELRIQTGDREFETTFVYNGATGELDADNDYDIIYEGIGEVIDNYFYDSDYGDTYRTFKFYRDTQNKPVLYGVNDDDTSEEDIITTLCHYTSVAQRPSPAEEAAAQVEAEKFKYVTAPGQGLQLADIEGIIHTGENVYTVTGLQFEEATYLLLKDGTVYKNLQVPPADLNVTDS